MAKTADLLVAYGYQTDDNISFHPGRPSGESWVDNGDGTWTCLAHSKPSREWGQDMGDGTWKIPSALLPEFSMVSGVHPAQHPQFFDWTWPDAKVNEIYAHLPEVGPDGTYTNPWVRTDDGELVRKS